MTIKLVGSSSGSVSLQAPATTTGGANRVITLPDAADGTVLTTTNPKAGNILQVVQTVKTDTFTTQSGSLVDITGLSLSITPSSTSSKILINVSFNHSITTTDRWMQFQLVRDSTAIYLGDTASSRTRASIFTAYTGSNNNVITNSNIVFLDSPSTTSATTYKLQGACQTDSAPYLVINRSKNDSDANYGGRSASSITAMEVAA